ncbi:MAG: hypothetical protein DHS20C12_02200 [Pseudohongiella sp.]|nr:MAG: hypothetical protein DHS20C12_02200 [Pseudohongiella sp.]
MYKFLLFVVSLSVATSLSAQSAAFEDDVLQIPGVGVVDGADAAFYSGVELLHEGDGVFRLVGGQNHTLVSVEEISIVISPDHTQAAVSVEGFKSNPCVDIEWPSVSKIGEEFNVVIAESVLGPAESCVAVLDPYTRAVTLELGGLLAGIYTVKVNGVSTEFTLDVDAP